MIVGEAPWKAELKAGEPFVGDAGDRLDLRLREHPVAHRDIYITNVFKGDVGDVIRQPSDPELWNHFPLLVLEIAMTRPKRILALGRTASRVLLPDRMARRHRHRIEDAVRRVYTSPFCGVDVYPCYHPARPKTEDQLEVIHAQLRRFFAPAQDHF